MLSPMYLCVILVKGESLGIIIICEGKGSDNIT